VWPTLGSRTAKEQNRTQTKIILKLPSKMPIYAEKTCDRHTLLKYAKNAARSEIWRQSHIRIKLACPLNGRQQRKRTAVVIEGYNWGTTQTERDLLKVT